jgi:signal transduction histidine kinase
MSHEINNSLTPIITVAGSLRHRLKSAGKQEAVADGDPSSTRALEHGITMISDRAESLSRFIGGYARLAKLPQPVRRATPVAPLLRRIAGLERRLRIALEGDERCAVHADAAQLEQLLINLVTNAVDAVADVEGGEVAVHWYGAKDTVTIDIVDNGPGVPDAARTFVPFFTTKPTGSGIGLALSRQIAEAHEGSLLLLERDSRPGTIARLRLPAAYTD